MFCFTSKNPLKLVYLVIPTTIKLFIVQKENEDVLRTLKWIIELGRVGNTSIYDHTKSFRKTTIRKCINNSKRVIYSSQHMREVVSNHFRDNYYGYYADLFVAYYL